MLRSCSPYILRVHGRRMSEIRFSVYSPLKFSSDNDCSYESSLWKGILGNAIVCSEFLRGELHCKLSFLMFSDSVMRP